MININSMQFSLDFDEVSVKLGDEDYLLRELSGKDRDKYLNNVGGRLKTDKNGNEGVKNFDKMQAALLSLALKKINEEGTLESVSIEFIQGIRASVQKVLYDTARELSGFTSPNELKIKDSDDSDDSDDLDDLEKNG